MLEPRRLAAFSAARWMAQELGEQIGRTLGYSIRFDSRQSDQTRIEVVTEGILTRRMSSNPSLEGVAMVIFDEFHERSLQADLALGLCLDIQRSLREDLKILVMSATMDCGPISDLLGRAPILSIGGELFPVEEQYLDQDRSLSLEERTARAVATALRVTTGDILVFLPGAGEIRKTAEVLLPLAENRKEDISIHSLYGDLPFEEQERVLLPLTKRKVVLATNIAETSLTIEGIGVVIDSGLARRLQYDPRSGLNRLLTVPISRASAEQRKGRAGRLSPGTCYRLYSRHEFLSRPEYTPPEMFSVDLASLVLELTAWGIKDPAALSWLDKPPGASWEGGKQLLVSLEALDATGSLTQTGRRMVPIPLHPRLSRMLLKSSDLGCLRIGADLAALLSERDIFRQSISSGSFQKKAADIEDRIEVLQEWRKGNRPPAGVDLLALRTVDRVSLHLQKLLPSKKQREGYSELIPRLMLHAYPDRIAKKREEGVGRFLLAQGQGVRIAESDPLSRSPYIVAVQVDSGERSEGRVHLAEPVAEVVIREEMGDHIYYRRRIVWDKREGRIIAALEEGLGSIVFSSRPVSSSDEEAAPLLCAGAIGYRSLRLTRLRDGERIGLTGFGASGHLVMRMLRHLYPKSGVFVFSRTASERHFAEELGACWTGDTEEEAPEKLRAVIDTTPAWKPVVRSLRNLERGGRLVVNAIRKEEGDKGELLSLDYSRDLWMEKEIRSVANITRKDVEEFLLLAAEIPIRPEIQEYRLEEANTALRELKERKIRGAKVLRIG